MRTALSWTALGAGGLLCSLNFYLSFLRYPVHRLRGLPKEAYRWISGIPLFGSALVALSLIGLSDLPGVVLGAILLIAIDTGGIHWFVGTVIYQSLIKRKRS